MTTAAIFRWFATVTYRTETGPSAVDYAFDELFELHDLVEAGPSWDCIEAISICLNPCRPQRRLTIEKAAEE